MLFGNLQGLINGTEQIVFDHEVTGSPVSSIDTGNILNGDEDGWYTIIYRGVTSGANNDHTMRINGDVGSNYGARGIYASNTTVANQNVENADVISIGSSGDSGPSCFSITKLYAKSGNVRLLNSTLANYFIGSTIDNIKLRGSVWNNSVDNITSLQFQHSSVNLEPGTRVIILKTNNAPIATETGKISTPYIKGTWVRVGSQILTAPTSVVTFSGLDGDRDIIYLWSMITKRGSVGECFIQFTANNFIDSDWGYQTLFAIDSSIQASRNTAQKTVLGYQPTASAYNQANGILFAKSGFLRPMISNSLWNIDGTIITRLYIQASSLNNINTNITSLSFENNSVNGFAIGSQFELYALRPNG